MGSFIDKIQERKINDKYSLIKKIGQGGHGAVYLGRDLDTGEEVALKLEHRDIEPSILAEEAYRYSSFDGLPGVPKLYWYGWHDDFKILVFELLGPSLEDLFQYCGGRLSLKTNLMIMDQLLTRMEAFHSCGFLHRDIKPQNCLFGVGANGNTVYLTDFGIAEEYSSEAGEGDESRRRGSRLVGTTRYASVRGHLGLPQLPKDDLESLLYMIIYFLKGRLPWQGQRASKGVNIDEVVLQMKTESSVKAELFAGLPDEFKEYGRYLESLQPAQTPDYAWLRELFRKLALKEKIEYDNVWDWTVLIYLQQL